MTLGFSSACSALRQLPCTGVVIKGLLVGHEHTSPTIFLLVENAVAALLMQQQAQKRLPAASRFEGTSPADCSSLSWLPPQPPPIQYLTGCYSAH